MISIKLIERQPDDLFVDRLLHALSESARDLFRRGATIAASPDQRRSFVEAMSPITIEIVNESFVGKCLHHQALSSRARLSLVIWLHAEFALLIALTTLNDFSLERANYHGARDASITFEVSRLRLKMNRAKAFRMQRTDLPHKLVAKSKPGRRGYWGRS